MREGRSSGTCQWLELVAELKQALNLDSPSQRALNVPGHRSCERRWLLSDRASSFFERTCKFWSLISSSESKDGPACGSVSHGTDWKSVGALD